MLHLVHNKT